MCFKRTVGQNLRVKNSNYTLFYYEKSECWSSRIIAELQAEKPPFNIALIVEIRELNAPIRTIGRRSSPQTLLLHGSSDTTVGPHHTLRLKAKLEGLGVPTKVRIYPETNHTRVVGSLASSLRFLNPAFEDIEHFLHAADLYRYCGQVAEDGA